MACCLSLLVLWLLHLDDIAWRAAAEHSITIHSDLPHAAQQLPDRYPCRYQDYQSSDIPSVQGPGSQVRVMAGQLQGVTGGGGSALGQYTQAVHSGSLVALTALHGHSPVSSGVALTTYNASVSTVCHGPDIDHVILLDSSAAQKLQRQLAHLTCSMAYNLLQTTNDKP